MTPAPARPFRPKPLDWTKPLRTRDGRKARFLGMLEGGSVDPYVVAVPCGESGVEEPWTYSSSGDYILDVEENLDLENAPETRVIEVWVNVYESGEVWGYPTENAALVSSPSRTVLLVAHRITAEVEIP